MQDQPEVIEKQEIEPKFGYGICKHCGERFIRTSRLRKDYCDSFCQRAAQCERDKEKRSEYYRNYMARKRAEEKL